MRGEPQHGVDGVGAGVDVGQWETWPVGPRERRGNQSTQGGGWVVGAESGENIRRQGHQHGGGGERPQGEDRVELGERERREVGE